MKWSLNGHQPFSPHFELCSKRAHEVSDILRCDVHIKMKKTNYNRQRESIVITSLPTGKRGARKQKILLLKEDFCKNQNCAHINCAKEKIRFDYYFKLISDYHHQVKHIEFDVAIPGSKGEIIADLVVYSDDNKEKPYIVIDVREQGVSDMLFERASRQVVAKARSLHAPYALFLSGKRKRAMRISLSDKEGNGIDKVISDIPVIHRKQED